MASRHVHVNPSHAREAFTCVNASCACGVFMCGVHVQFSPLGSAVRLQWKARPCQMRCVICDLHMSMPLVPRAVIGSKKAVKVRNSKVNVGIGQNEQ